MEEVESYLNILTGKPLRRDLLWIPTCRWDSFRTYLKEVFNQIDEIIITKILFLDIFMSIDNTGEYNPLK